MKESAVTRIVPAPGARVRPRRTRGHERRQRRSVAVRVPVVRPTIVERAGLPVLLLFLLASLGLHLGGEQLVARFVSLVRAEPKPPQNIQVAVIERTIPPPAKLEAPKPEPVRVKPIVHRNLPPPPPNTPPPRTTAPPPPTHAPPQPTTDVPVIAGLSMDSTSTSGSFAVATGNTFGTPGGVAPRPADVKPYKAVLYAASYELSEDPVPLNNVGDDELRKYYPPQAMHDGIEAQVRTKITVDDDGSVVRVTVVGDPGNGFAEAARKVLKLFKFKPGKKNGHAVATEIPFTLDFELPN